MKKFLSVLFLAHAITVSAQEECLQEDKKAEKYYQKAWEAAKAENFAEAEGFLQQSLQQAPDYIKSLHLFARIEAQQGSSIKASQYYEKIIELCPDYKADIYYDLGLLSYHLDDYQSCHTHFSAYLQQSNISAAKAGNAKDLQKECYFLDSLYSNPVPYDPKPVPGISTATDEYLPMISPDNESFFFTRSYLKKNKFGVVSEYMAEEFFAAQKDSIGFFRAGEALPEPFNTGNNEGGASVTIDNKELFITACNRSDGHGSCDIYHTSFDGQKWSSLQNLGPEINSYYWESQVSVSSDGSTLYFSSDREGGLGGYDIYKIVRDESGTWSSPVNLGAPINTAGNEKSPFIHVDNHTLYFSSDGHKGLGGLDIFISRKDEQGNWQRPENIGYPINSKEDDMGFFVSTSGQKGYFSSSKMKGRGGWDIYEFDLYEGARPKQVLFLKGRIEDENGNVLAGIKMRLKNLETDEIIEIPIDPATGEYVFTKTVENDEMLTVQKEGYFYDAQYIAKDDAAFTDPATLNFELKNLEVGSSYRINNILFDTDSYVLKKRSKLELDNLAEFMEINPSVQIAIHGHTDSIGHDEANLELSHNRAKAVYDYLLEKSIFAERLSYQGFGENAPAASNTTPQGRALNRRTEIKVLRK